MVKRPLYVWVVVLGLLWLALNAGLRLAGALTAWDWLETFGVLPGPLYVAISGAVFMLALAAAAGMLYIRARGFVWAVRGVTLAYALWYWLDRLLLTRDDTTRVNWPFVLAATLILAGYVFMVTATEAHRD